MNLRQNQKGFTIVELLIVVVVIAILAAISIVAYTGITNRANKSSAMEAANSAKSVAAAFQGSQGRYPTTKAEFVSGQISGGEPAIAKLPSDISFGTASTTYTNGSGTTIVPGITNPKTIYVYPCLATGMRIFYKDFTETTAANQVKSMDVGDCSTPPAGSTNNIQ